MVSLLFRSRFSRFFKERERGQGHVEFNFHLDLFWQLFQASMRVGPKLKAEAID